MKDRSRISREKFLIIFSNLNVYHDYDHEYLIIQCNDIQLHSLVLRLFSMYPCLFENIDIERCVQTLSQFSAGNRCLFTFKMVSFYIPGRKFKTIT